MTDTEPMSDDRSTNLGDLEQARSLIWQVIDTGDPAGGYRLSVPADIDKDHTIRALAELGCVFAAALAAMTDTTPAEALDGMVSALRELHVHPPDPND